MSDGISLEFNDKAFVRAMKRAPVEVGKEVSRAVFRTAIETTGKLKQAAPKAFSTLTNSIKQDRLDAFSYRVAPHVGYAPFVENGREPGKAPPLQSLMDWVKVKRIATGDRNVRNVAWAIAKKIAREGVKPQPFVQPLIDSGWPQQRLNYLANKAVKTGLKKAGL